MSRSLITLTPHAGVQPRQTPERAWGHFIGTFGIIEGDLSHCVESSSSYSADLLIFLHWDLRNHRLRAKLQGILQRGHVPICQRRHSVF
jgi:hypothetical protein